MVLSGKDEQTARKFVAPDHFSKWLSKGCRPYVIGYTVIYVSGNKLVVKRRKDEKAVADLLAHYSNQNPQTPLSATCLSIMASYKNLSSFQQRQVVAKQKKRKGKKEK